MGLLEHRSEPFLSVPKRRRKSLRWPLTAALLAMGLGTQHGDTPPQAAGCRRRHWSQIRRRGPQ